MTYQQPGAYPGMPPYPGGAGLPPKPPLPDSVRQAFYCMLAGAVLSVLSAVISFTQLGTIRSMFEKDLPSDDSTTINSLVTAMIVVAVVMALIEVGLWLWIAFAAKAGKNYARVVGTVFFGVSASTALFGTVGFFITSSNSSTSSAFASSDTVLGQIANWLTFLVGLAAVVLLWRKSSGQFFKPAQFYAGPYGYPGYAGYPGYGYPGYPQGAPGQPPYPGAQGALGQPPYQTAPYAAPPQGGQTPPPGTPQG